MGTVRPQLLFHLFLSVIVHVRGEMKENGNTKCWIMVAPGGRIFVL